MKKWQCVVCGLIYDESQGWPDDISNWTIQAGETVTGRVFVPCPQVDSTIMLIQGNGTDPVAALTISA